MKIISHRGYWFDYEKESNKRIAFEKSFDMGYGTETDIRDVNGKLVVSHDMPRGDEILFEELLQIMDGRNLPLALNIKADGQAFEIERILNKYNHTNYFTFDMSIPELVFQVQKTNLKVYSGYSDVNPCIPMKQSVVGVWVDSFFEPLYQLEIIDEILKEGKEICVVSEDLHGRDNSLQWKALKQLFLQNDNVMLCTNYLEDALRYFFGRV